VINSVYTRIDKKKIMGKWFLYISFFICFSNDFTIAQMTPTYVVSIPMRDGKFLAADVYVPSGNTSFPTVLIQTPYNKNAFRNGLPLGYLQNVNSRLIDQCFHANAQTDPNK